jgi:agmatine deiminase
MEQRDIHGDDHITIALIQMAMGTDQGKNLKSAEQKIRKAAARGAEIVCLPELFHTRYFPRYIRSDPTGVAQSIPGEITRDFCAIAREYGLVLIVPLFEKASGCRFYNTAVVIDADGRLHTPYHKVHIPDDPGFFEKGYFYPGDGFSVHNTRFGRIGVLICYDQWFPEAARAVALQGADIIFYPTAIGQPKGDLPVEGTWQEAWEIIQRSHAIANSVHIAAVNRVGTEGTIDFFGGSFICDAFGNVLARAGTSEEIVLSEADFSMNERVRDSWGFFRNRRPDTYAGICKGERYGKGSETIHRRSGGGESALQTGTPRNRGFGMPAEWGPHEAVWLAWPDNSDTFPHLEEVQRSFISFITALRGSERVELLVRDAAVRNRIKKQLKQEGPDASHVRFRTLDYTDVWIRDYGPTFVTNPALQQVSMVRWLFNAWGGKYEDHVRDGSIPGFIRKWTRTSSFEPGIVLEGGSVEVNGLGTIMTTRSCLLNRNRNPALSMDEIEEHLMEYLGGTHVIWLDKGIAGDDTDGHIDDIARFTGPRTVVCAWQDDKSDENYDALLNNFGILKQSRDQDNEKIKVVKLPMPSEISGTYGRYPASYSNFYIGNTVVIVPVFGDPKDREALKILQREFPGRKVIGIDATALVEGHGAFHCVTQQQPKNISFDPAMPCDERKRNTRHGR